VWSWLAFSWLTSRFFAILEAGLPITARCSEILAFAPDPPHFLVFFPQEFPFRLLLDDAGKTRLRPRLLHFFASRYSNPF